MKLLLIGHSVADIIDFMGEKTLKPGGIFYSVIALNNIKNSEDKIFLVTDMDNDHYFLFREEYEMLDGKIFNHVKSIPVVHLKILNEKEREETYENINQNLKFNIDELNSYDGILINMITGFDLYLEQLEGIRKNYNGLIYLDVHSLSRGLNDKMERHFRQIPIFKKWAANVDFVQVNKNELLTLSDKNNGEEIISEVLSYGPRYLILTLEDKGAEIFFLKDDNIKSVYLPGIKINVSNKVGCGDVFGAVFFYSYISSDENWEEQLKIFKALKLANIAAGCSASYNVISDFKYLIKDVVSRID